ncbi:3-oxo-5-alpha-steroid 4-dehydrogenase 1 isoform X2 [Chiloscyllium punctatum]|uniref:3-oxo-5-alpha-steroid 4-dehydrogenase 1 isoform X2 n=1 Tax=Chiloscyllium punctatum TaxID=137246 RepID=UPI003B6365B9
MLRYVRAPLRCKTRSRDALFHAPEACREVTWSSVSRAKQGHVGSAIRERQEAENGVRSTANQKIIPPRSLIFPFLIKGGKATPFIPFALAFIYCAFNGYLQARFLSKYAVYPSNWITDPRFLTGFALWIFGLLVNLHSDHILRKLRKPDETGYKIPHGGMFEYVSGANFLGEIIEWTGFAIACWSLPSAAFAVFGFFVLSARATQHHRWYLEKFEDYPKSRKALIPFVY